jgi:CBS domain-containing protein
MTIEEVMTRDVSTVSPTTPIHKAARLMVEHRAGDSGSCSLRPGTFRAGSSRSTRPTYLESLRGGGGLSARGGSGRAGD